MEQVIPITDKNFVGIGKFIFSVTNWSVPHLHFMVDKAPWDGYEATNLEFGLVSSGKTQEEATQHLALLIRSHISVVLNEGNGYNELIQTVKTHALDDFWAEYRAIDFSLGKRGRDLSHEIDRHITQAIQSLLDAQIKNIITRRAETKAEEVIKMYDDLAAVKIVTVQYTKLKDVA
jgi:hypothetical protein